MGNNYSDIKVCTCQDEVLVQPQSQKQLESVRCINAGLSIQRQRDCLDSVEFSVSAPIATDKNLHTFSQAVLYDFEKLSFKNSNTAAEKNEVMRWNSNTIIFTSETRHLHKPCFLFGICLDNRCRRQ